MIKTKLCNKKTNKIENEKKRVGLNNQLIPILTVNIQISYFMNNWSFLFLIL